MYFLSGFLYSIGNHYGNVERKKKKKLIKTINNLSKFKLTSQTSILHIHATNFIIFFQVK